MTRSRSEYLRRGHLGDVEPTPTPAGLRLVRDDDREAIAHLLLAAYRGTIDDEGEGEPEALAAAGFSLAIVDRQASVVVEDDRAGLAAMSFVVVVDGRHFIDPVATAADHKQAGLGTRAVTASLERLHDRGIDEVGAVITDGNTPSERLFARLGFERIGPWPRRPDDLPGSAPS